MSNYRRAWTPAGTFFFTVALAERHSSLLVDEIASLRRAFASAKKARPFDIDAVVILPDHLHSIWTLPAGDIDFATRWAHIKTVFCRHLPKTELRSESRSRKRERGVWQRRYWEHRIRDEADYTAHFDLRAYQSGEARSRISYRRMALVVVPQLCSAGSTRTRLG